MKSKKIAVVLSGCGHRDGSEITEAVSVLIAISQTGAEYQCFAPDFNFDPTNHISGEEVIGEQRNILIESARIARGSVEDIKSLYVKDYDAVVFPGGYGAATQLSSWGNKGASCEVLPEVKRVISEFHAQSKPIGAICIAPTLVARVLGSKKPELTIGNHKETALEINKTGAVHVECPVEDFITDRDHKIVSTPAYMYNAKPHQIFKGISKMINELVEMA
jgi:enhancing lycopene biosynthesis protein 2